jgi:hydrogenase maturation protease
LNPSSPEARAGIPELLIFGYGNPSRGDDALGPLLVERLEPLLSRDHRRIAGGIETLTDFQLQVEHALDLTGRRLVLFVDAHLDCPSPWRLSVLHAETDASYSTHAISPGSVLRVYEDIKAVTPPPSFLLGVRGECFELGEPLSQNAAAYLEEALTLVLTLCGSPSPEYWLSRCI